MTKRVGTDGCVGPDLELGNVSGMVVRFRLCTGLMLSALCAGTAVWGAQAARVPQVKFVDYRLPNGLRVILSVDHSAPVVALSVTYNVGSRNEHPGHTGFAHLFEHMMFQGSANVGKGEHMLLIQNNGGAMNGTTNQDRTNYFEELPANQLDLALFLESDRMRALDISQANLDNQRAVVQEEKRQSYDNQPYGAMSGTVSDLAYDSFAYKHTTIGSMADLNAATLDDVKAFFKTYYAPNNACIALVGDFSEGEARKKIEHYFGDISRQPDPPPVEVAETLNEGEKRKVLSDPLARLVRYEAAFKTVPGDQPDSYALQVLAGILSRGRTGRLYKAIVETRMATSARAFEGGSRGPGLFTLNATLPPGGDPKAVEAAFDREIASIQTDGVTADEMAKAKVQSRASAILGASTMTALGRANGLSQMAELYNDPALINTDLNRLEAVTAVDVQRVAKTYLTKANRVVVIVTPQAAEDDGGPR